MSKSPSLRRIQADIRELALDPSDQYCAAPLEHDMFEWHFTIRGAVGTDFEGGVYHGRILLPAEYPYKPPHIVFLTPSGRFETNTKVCLSFSAYHPELWQPAWGIRLILEALISFLPTPGDGAIGALDYKPEERKRLAKKSQSWCCPTCCGGPVVKLLPKLDENEKNKAAKSGGGGGSSFSKEIAELQRLQQEREGGNINKNNNKNKKKEAAKEKTTKEKTTAATSTTTTTTSDSSPATAAPPEEEEQKQKVEVEVTEVVTKEKEKDDTTYKDSATTDVAEDNIVTAATTGEAEDPQQINNNNIVNDDADVVAVDDVPATGSDISWLYDPLMNLTILLMFCICVLLWRKGIDLSRELKELREMIPMVDNLMEKTKASAAASVAASAAASEEL